jgi:hypothetical protein
MPSEANEVPVFSAALADNPVKAVLKAGETYEELRRQCQYCEITWPQCYVFGPPIYLTSRPAPK